MNTKSLILAGIAGGIADFLLGWLFYGIVFSAYFPQEMPNLVFIALGCLCFGFLISYIFIRWANIYTVLGGLKGGATLGFIIGLMNNFFMREGSETVDYTNFALDLAISVVVGAIVGAVVAATYRTSRKA